ncbi:hypothetical protein C5Y93_07725 [Blastopirellula marina]|uniref:Cation efflux protein transmembrane domain-containing protein n=2 Tax=Blastopirellula marina TaxID=124 RepID=A0A2S8GRR4_9BACT|nr:hypothetical protein C5Y93_07725 [Blastopirellula marina]
MPSPESHLSIEQRSLQLGKWGNLVMGVSGIAGAYASHSDALLVDGLYSGVNFFSAMIAARISLSIQSPADARYPLGYEAYEAIYVKYRALVLLGILSYAVFGAVSKIITYATGGEVPDLNFGPIILYMVAMVALCFGLAWWHYWNWRRTGSQSVLLSTEAKASVVDGIISAGAGGGLVGSLLLRGTFLEFIVPVSDSIVVILMCGCIVWQPLRIFLDALHEIAGGTAADEICAKTSSLVEAATAGHAVEILAVTTTKLGRTYFVIAYLNPKTPVAAAEVDHFRQQLETNCQKTLGPAKTEVIITAQAPYATPKAAG